MTRSFSTLPLALSLAFAAGCRGAGASEGASPVDKVEGDHVTLAADSARRATFTSSPALAPADDSLHLGGRVAWNEDVTVRVFAPFSGRVSRVITDAGRTVRQGDTLALVASPDFGQAQADARRAAADLALADRNVTRTRALFAHGVAPAKDVEAAEADFARAKAEAARASARVALYGGDSAAVNQLFPLRAPLGGTVVERNVSPGQEIRPDQMLANDSRLVAPLFVVTDPTRLWVQLDVAERDVGALRERRALVIRALANPSRAYAGTVTVVGDAVDPQTRTITVRGTLDNADRSLKAGMLVSVDLASGPAAGVRVPASALLLAGTTQVAFVEEGPGRYRRVTVSGTPGPGGTVSVTSGLKAGDKVVVSGTVLLEQIFRRDSGG